MAIDRVKAYFREFGMEQRVRELTVSSATVELAAEAVGVIPARIAKSLTFLAKDESKCYMILAAGDAKIDNSKYKQFFHCKAKMLTPDEVEAIREARQEIERGELFSHEEVWA